MHLAERTSGIEYAHSRGLGARNLQVGFANACEEGKTLGFEAVGIAPGICAPQSSFDRRVQKYSKVRPQSVLHELLEHFDMIARNSPTTALIRESRVGESIGDDDSPRRQRRPDHFRQVLRPRRENKQEFRRAVNGHFRMSEQHGTDRFSRRGSPRFPCQADTPAAGLKQLRKKFRMGAFAGALDAFQGDEEAVA